jgi:hypothetical protein
VKRWKVISSSILLSSLVFSACSSNDPATNDLIQKDIMSSTPSRPGLATYPSPNSSPQNSTRIYSPIGGLGNVTNIAEGAGNCTGAAGSIVPPLAPIECTSMVVALPLVALASILPDAGPNVILDGIERFWVRQTSDNTCWAAALETARAYLGLQPIPQDAIYNGVAADCPALREQKNGATMYQIVTAIRQLAQRFDGARIDPHFCNDTPCLLHYLNARRPVLALRNGHVVLIVGMLSYSVSRNTSAPPTAPNYSSTSILPRNGPPATSTPTKFIVVAEHYLILDPAGDGKPERVSQLEFCRSDAFIAL